MKLVAEQIEYLRKRRKELESKKREYLLYCQSRDSIGFDKIGLPHYSDYQAEMENSQKRKEIEEIDSLLSNAEFVRERNFDCIDVGTGFYVRFDGEDSERAMLVDVGSGYQGREFFTSLDSDFGKAVLGHKPGDVVTYKVQATGRMITVTIDDIDRMRENYTHFIKEKDFTDRISRPASDELRRLKQDDIAEYQNRHAITPSQVLLLLEEKKKIPSQSKRNEDISRRAHIEKILRESKVAGLPTGDKISVGSIVEVIIQEEGKEPVTKKFEMINRAVSTETDGAYVERISTLGQAIYGLRSQDTFQIKRCHKPSLKGIVSSVENYDDEKERVR